MSTSAYIALGVYILFVIISLMIWGALGAKPNTSDPSEDWMIPLVASIFWPLVLISIVAYVFFKTLKLTVVGIMLVGYIIDDSIREWRLKRRCFDRKEK